MRIDLTGKTAVVTGGVSGIGAAIAAGFAEAGARVVATQLGDALDSRNDRLTRLDITDREAVGSFFDELSATRGGADILVNNAGIVSYHDFLDLDPDEWDRMLATNLTGAMLCSQQAARQMRAKGNGRIINVTSIAARRPAPRRSHYCVSKAGLDMLTRNMALELGPLGITVNAIGPGTIETDMTRAPLQNEALKASIVHRTPLGRLGMPEDLTGAALFLASDAAGFITGQTIFVDGGQLL